MSGSFDEAIRRSMLEAAQRKQQPVSAPTPLPQQPMRPGKVMMTDEFAPQQPPGGGASVPPDSVRDYKFYVQQTPDVGNFPRTPPQYSEEELQDKDRRQQMTTVLDQLTTMMASPQQRDTARADALLNQYRSMSKASPSYQASERSNTVETNSARDADVMERAMLERERKGRAP